jgi:type II secretory ATPase GspE/PulE/Tfp pilus assembly ATPase PilB-like protein
VRIRVDGCLHVILTPPKKLHSAIIARFKVLSGLDITKRRIPQDGHLSVEFGGEPVHFRISTLPTIFGEKCVIRLLQKNPELIALDRIGFELDDLILFRRALASPQGLILVTGPTGSGKTTTLHAGLHQVSNNAINIVTLEDPVEMTIDGINHVPIHRNGGVNFADGLRAILRQDPDVIFVGEMRDPEVGAIAMRAAQTGHLVLSTLHTNSAVESVVRLIDLEIPHYLVASSLLMVISQRLLRRVCELCAEPIDLNGEERDLLGLSAGLPPESNPRRGRGCPACLNTGYRGRIAVFEVLDVNAEVHTLLRRRAQPDELWAAARRAGARSILEAGAVKVLRGETTAAEVARVLMTRA